MFKEKKYDPVTTAVPGVDQQQRETELTEIFMAGDPQTLKETPKEEVIFKKFGLKIVR